MKFSRWLELHESRDADWFAKKFKGPGVYRFGFFAYGHNPEAPDDPLGKEDKHIKSLEDLVNAYTDLTTRLPSASDVTVRQMTADPTPAPAKEKESEHPAWKTVYGRLWQGKGTYTFGQEVDSDYGKQGSSFDKEINSFSEFADLLDSYVKRGIHISLIRKRRT